MAVLYDSIGGHTTSPQGHAIDGYVAHLPGVLAEVLQEGIRVQAIAEGIFAQHDRPGGHSIVGGHDGITDYYIYLEGPVPHIIEWGRKGYYTKKTQRLGDSIIPEGTWIPAWEGTHVLRRTVELA